MTHERHQVGDQQEGQRVCGDNCRSVSGRLRGHVHQHAGAGVHYRDRSLGSDEHRLHRFGQPVAADRYLSHRCGKVGQLWHQHSGQDQLRNQGERNDRGRLISRVGKRRDHQSHCRARHRTDRQEHKLLRTIAWDAVGQRCDKHIDNSKLQDGECAGHEIFRTNERRSRKVDVVFTPVNRKFADDILRRAVTAEPDRAQAKQQQQSVLRVDTLQPRPKVTERVAHQAADEHALSRSHHQCTTIGQQQDCIPM
jgi:hypothetical protein